MPMLPGSIVILDRVWIPFTRKLIDLHEGRGEDNTPIHLVEDRDVDCQWWRFEEGELLV